MFMKLIINISAPAVFVNENKGVFPHRKRPKAHGICGLAYAFTIWSHCVVFIYKEIDRQLKLRSQGP